MSEIIKGLDDVEYELRMAKEAGFPWQKRWRWLFTDEKGWPVISGEGFTRDGAHAKALEQLNLHTSDPCSSCGGSGSMSIGWQGDTSEICGYCHGLGRVRKSY